MVLAPADQGGRGERVDVIHEKRTDILVIGEGATAAAVRTVLGDDDRYRLFADQAVLKAKRPVDPQTGAPVYALASAALQELVKWYWSRWFGFVLLDCTNYEKWPQHMTTHEFTAPPLSIPTVMFDHTAKLGARDEQVLADEVTRGGRRFFLIRAVQPGVAVDANAAAVAARDQVLPFAVKQYNSGTFGLFNWWEHNPPIQ